VSVPREERFRRLLRWYPRAWRERNGEVLLGAMLEEAERAGRAAPTTAERLSALGNGVGARLDARLALRISLVALVLATAAGGLSTWGAAALAATGLSWSLPVLSVALAPALVAVGVVALARDRGFVSGPVAVLVASLSPVALAAAALAQVSWAAGFEAADRGVPATGLASAWLVLVLVAWVLGAATIAVLIGALLSRVPMPRAARVLVVALGGAILAPAIGIGLVVPYAAVFAAAALALLCVAPAVSRRTRPREAERDASGVGEIPLRTRRLARALAAVSSVASALGVGYALTGSGWGLAADSTAAMAQGIAIALLSGIPLLAAAGALAGAHGRVRSRRIWGPLLLVGLALGATALAYRGAPDGDRMAGGFALAAALEGGALAWWLAPGCAAPGGPGSRSPRSSASATRSSSARSSPRSRPSRSRCSRRRSPSCTRAGPCLPRRPPRCCPMPVRATPIGAAPGRGAPSRPRLVPVETRELGSSGLSLPVVGLGGNNFGRAGTRTEEQEGTTAVVDAALEAGVTFIDTADMYGKEFGLSERLLGVALRGRRDRAIVATKFGHTGIPTDLDALGAKGSRAYVRAAAEASLTRLGIETIDLYQQHTPDPSTPIAETIAALDELVGEGKIRFYGHSNFSAEQIAEAQRVAAELGARGFVSAQNEYNLLTRGVEAEVLPAVEAAGIGFLPFFPLANGLLTGKFTRDERPADSRIARQRPHLADEAPWDALDAFRDIAAERGASMLDAAFGWLLSRPSLTSVIAGATRPEQIVANAAAGNAWRPTAEEAARIDALFPIG